MLLQDFASPTCDHNISLTSYYVDSNSQRIYAPLFYLHCPTSDSPSMEAHSLFIKGPYLQGVHAKSA